MELLENIIWIYLTIPLLFAVSVFFTIYMKAPQFRFGKIKRSFQKKDNQNQISPFSTLLIALSARIGLGTLAGTGLAIAVGGPGAIFWMWISAIITAAATFAENTIAQKFKQGSSDNYYGGPAFYIKHGLKRKKFAGLYALIFIVTYTLGFVAVQMNTITATFTQSTGLSPTLIGVVLVILTALTIMGSITKIAKLIAAVIPFIAIFFLGVALVAIMINFSYIPAFFAEIITSAFDFNSAVGGGIGVAITTGIKRGVFSNEAGLGTGSHAAALTHHKDPREQGYIGVLGIYLTSIVAITLVAFIIMSSGAHRFVTPTGNGIEFLHFSLLRLFGSATSVLLPLIIFFFGFSTVVTAYLYGIMNIKFLTAKKSAPTMLRLILLFVVFLAATTNPRFIWRLVDIGVGLTAIINLSALVLLRKYLK